MRPVGSKASRAHAVAPLLEAGQLGFCPGNDDLITELLGFPNAAHDDLVDAFCQGVIWLQNQHWLGSDPAIRPTALLMLWWLSTCTLRPRWRATTPAAPATPKKTSSSWQQLG